MANNFILPLNDFQQIYRTVYSVIDSQKGITIKSCFYFNTAASAILEKHYSLDFKTYCGFAAYKLTKTDPVFIFGKFQKSQLASDMSAFHCWLFGHDWVLDFMSPLFNRMALNKGMNVSIPTKMFQKKLSARSNSVNTMNTVGDYLYEVNSSVNNISNFFKTDTEQDRYLDLVDQCVNWYQSPPNPMQTAITILDVNRQPIQVQLSQDTLTGAW